jgi:F-type H+-transporting ATPase subunit delta
MVNVVDALASHYARALADAVFAPNSGLSPEDTIQQLRSIASLVLESKELRWALLSPSVTRARKTAITARLAELMGLHRLLRNFLLVVVTHRRTQELDSIRRSFEAIVDERLGFVRADIAAATELTAEQREQIERALGTIIGKFIRPHYTVDPSLLGGVVARVGSKEYDGTLRGRLESLRHRLARPS